MADSVQLLVTAVKDLQRSNHQAREQWGIYCESHGGGVRDPSKHPFEFLNNFLSQFNSGFRYETPANGGAAAAASPGAGIGSVELGLLFKEGQRKSHNWKSAWAAYTQIYGRGMNDPTKHDTSFLVSFLDFLGQQGYLALAPAAGTAAAVGPPAKRARMDSPAGFSPAAGGVVSSLADRVKNFQRSGPAQKEAWWNFVDTHYKGLRDPARHDNATLEAFIASHGVP